MKNLPDFQLANRYYDVRDLPTSFQNMLLVYKVYNTEEMSKPIRPGSHCSNPEVKPSQLHGRPCPSARIEADE